MTKRTKQRLEVLVSSWKLKAACDPQQVICKTSLWEQWYTFMSPKMTVVLWDNYLRQLPPVCLMLLFTHPSIHFLTLIWDWVKMTTTTMTWLYWRDAEPSQLGDRNSPATPGFTARPPRNNSCPKHFLWKTFGHRDQMPKLAYLAPPSLRNSDSTLSSSRMT